jgi:hypothetical protein
MTKTYLVQGWDEQGALINNYEVVLEGDSAKRDLLKFLKTKNSHVALTEVKTPKPKARR